MISKPKYKICRRLGGGVYDKCQTPKFSATTGGKKFNARPKALSEYGTQLIEKQKTRFSYGISENQLSNYVKKALKLGGVGTVDRFYERLESRLDNVIYRLGLSASRRSARQMVSHGHFLVNDRKVTIPSYEMKKGDVIKIREGSKSKAIFKELNTNLKDFVFPAWLVFDINKLEGRVLDKPKNTESFLDLNAVLEFYSR